MSSGEWIYCHPIKSAHKIPEYLVKIKVICLRRQVSIISKKNEKLTKGKQLSNLNQQHVHCGKHQINNKKFPS